MAGQDELRVPHWRSERQKANAALTFKTELAYDPEKHALGFAPTGVSWFPKRSCAIKNPKRNGAST
jgi:hypothetical protein